MSLLLTISFAFLLLSIIFFIVTLCITGVATDYTGATSAIFLFLSLIFILVHNIFSFNNISLFDTIQ